MADVATVIENAIINKSKYSDNPALRKAAQELGKSVDLVIGTSFMDPKAQMLRKLQDFLTALIGNTEVLRNGGF